VTDDTEVGYGVSPLMQAKYRGDERAVEALLADEAELDVFEAAAVGQTERVRELVHREPQLARAWSSDGFTALHLAAFFGHAQAVRVLLEAGADASAKARNTFGVEPLHSAAASRNLEGARLLLDAGADPNAVQPDGFRPIDAALQNEDEPLRRLLVDHGADASLARLPPKAGG
jgi:uncharacterized protein